MATHYEEIKSHNQGRHKNYAKSIARVDQLLYNKAKIELNFNLPRHFPTIGKLRKLIAQPRIQTSPVKNTGSKLSVFQRLNQATEQVTKPTTSKEITTTTETLAAS